MGFYSICDGFLLHLRWVSTPSAMSFYSICDRFLLHLRSGSTLFATASHLVNVPPPAAWRNGNASDYDLVIRRLQITDRRGYFVGGQIADRSDDFFCGQIADRIGLNPALRMFSHLTDSAEGRWDYPEGRWDYPEGRWDYPVGRWDYPEGRWDYQEGGGEHPQRWVTHRSTARPPGYSSPTPAIRALPRLSDPSLSFFPSKARPFVFPLEPWTAYIRFGSVPCDSSLAFGSFHPSLERIVLGSVLGCVLSRAAPALVLSFAVGAERTELALSAEKTELALEASSTKPILDPPTTKLALHVVTVQILPFCLALRLAKTPRRATYIRMVAEAGCVGHLAGSLIRAVRLRKDERLSRRRRALDNRTETAFRIVWDPSSTRRPESVHREGSWMELLGRKSIVTYSAGVRTSNSP
ncbi:hypothetical protein GGG16DRAFT_100000 [Schizophyllum commune]